MGIYVESLTTTEGVGGEAINLLGLERTKENWREEKKQHDVIHHAENKDGRINWCLSAGIKKDT